MISSRLLVKPGGVGQRGFALLTVLWLTMLLAIIAASFTTTARTEIQFGRNAVDKARAEALAEAGVSLAVLALLEPDPAARWRTDGTTYAFAFAGGEIHVSIQDEAGKVDLNFASDELLHAAFVAAGVGEEQAGMLVDAVADFRDEDDLRSLAGAEDADYAAAGLPYGAKDAPFDAVDELQQVLGVTPQLYRRVAPLLTVFSWQDGLDPLTARPELLEALPGITPGQVEQLLAARADLAGGPGANLGPLARLGGQARPEREGPLAGREDDDGLMGDPFAIVEPLIEGLEGFLSGYGEESYTVRAEARSEGGAVFVREAILSLTGAPGQPFFVHDWKRGRRGAAGWLSAPSSATGPVSG